MFAGGFEKIAISTKAVQKALASNMINNYLPFVDAGIEGHPATDLLNKRIKNSMRAANKATTHKERIGHLRNAVADSRKVHNWYRKNQQEQLKQIFLRARPSKLNTAAILGTLAAAGAGAAYITHMAHKKSEAPNHLQNKYTMLQY